MSQRFGYFYGLATTLTIPHQPHLLFRASTALLRTSEIGFWRCGGQCKTDMATALPKCPLSWKADIY